MPSCHSYLRRHWNYTYTVPVQFRSTLFNRWYAEARLVARKVIWKVQILHDVILKTLIALLTFLTCFYMKRKTFIKYLSTWTIKIKRLIFMLVPDSKRNCFVRNSGARAIEDCKSLFYSSKQLLSTLISTVLMRYPVFSGSASIQWYSGHAM
jgi:hypothetical protein